MDLNSHYALWKKGKLSFDFLQDQILHFLINEANHRIPFLTEDERQEALLKFYTKISEIVEKYKNGGFEFSNYCFMQFFYYVRTIRSHQIESSLRSLITTNKEYATLRLPKAAIACEASNFKRDLNYITSYSKYDTRDLVSFDTTEEQLISKEELAELEEKYKEFFDKNKKNKKFVLIFFLKNISELNHYEIESYINLFGFNREQILSYISEINELIEPKRQRKQKYLEILNRQFNTLQLLRYRKCNCENPLEKENLNERIELTEAKIARNTKRYQDFSVEPSNKELASILKIPKGTVDSILVNKKDITLPQIPVF